ncbi:MAG: maleylpyruvate isomerase family mycothiol-dependent enzyme [Acidimicrobiales bacterium]|nr:maleylpyruvate isomerase family mycothiol-dependent enzyme [Acidimicrobiales bacterium]
MRFTVPIGDPAVPLLRQRRRLGEILAGLDEAQWASPSRCEKWAVRDVVAHLIGTDQFWALSVTSGLAGEPTRFLTEFDPVVTPLSMVESMNHLGSAEVLSTYLAGVNGLESAFGGLHEAQWMVLAEGPPGHVPAHTLASHALWDGWIHERDIVLPLGMTPTEEPDEVAACLRYASAIGPAFLASSGSTRRGTLSVEGTDPAVRVLIEAGETVVVGDGEPPADAVRLEGPSVALVEALTFRAPLEQDVPKDDRWLLGGLATVFDRAAEG